MTKGGASFGSSCCVWLPGRNGRLRKGVQASIMWIIGLGSTGKNDRPSGGGEASRKKRWCGG